MKTYPVQMEIAGPFAYFGDPASGAAFQTYLVPPSSATEGMFRAIVFLRDGAYIPPTRACQAARGDSFRVADDPGAIM